MRIFIQLTWKMVKKYQIHTLINNICIVLGFFYLYIIINIISFIIISQNMHIYSSNISFMVHAKNISIFPFGDRWVWAMCWCVSICVFNLMLSSFTRSALSVFCVWMLSFEYMCWCILQLKNKEKKSLENIISKPCRACKQWQHK